MERESKFKKKISDSVKEEGKISKGAYDGLSKEQILKRMIFGGEEEPEILTPLESWMRRYGFTEEEAMATGRFNKDGSLKEVK